jgi:hypothetical protein
MTTKYVTDKAQKTTDLATRIAARREEIVANLKALSLELGVTLKADYGLVVQDLEALGNAAAQTAIAADQTHGAGQTGHATIASPRDAATHTLHAAVDSAYESLRSQFGAAQIAPAFPKPTPRASSQLSAYVGQTVLQLKALGSKWTTLPSSVSPPNDIPAIAAKLDAARAVLDAALTQVAAHEAGTATAGTERAHAVTRLENVFHGIHHAAEGLLEAGGQLASAAALVEHSHAPPAAPATTPPAAPKP